jgi:hypothetical protein
MSALITLRTRSAPALATLAAVCSSRRLPCSIERTPASRQWAMLFGW